MDCNLCFSGVRKTRGSKYNLKLLGDLVSAVYTSGDFKILGNSRNIVHMSGDN